MHANANKKRGDGRNPLGKISINSTLECGSPGEIRTPVLIVKLREMGHERG